MVRKLNWFTNKRRANLEVDIHSHLLPGLDDGVKSFDESLKILNFLQGIGYKKVVTTPHISSEYYPNTPDTISQRLAVLLEKSRSAGLTIKIEAAAEYLMDEHFMELIAKEKLMTFGKDDYVLIETGFISKPWIYEETVFKLKTTGYVPVLAHPERYRYLEGDIGWLVRQREAGVKLQMTAGSLEGFYGKDAQKMSNMMIKEKIVDFIGSDIHAKSHLDYLYRFSQRKIIPQLLLNNRLL